MLKAAHFFQTLYCIVDICRDGYSKKLHYQTKEEELCKKNNRLGKKEAERVWW
ncbi:MAG: hypothetical protein J6A59_09780 [Lachnospiraceae bacterium]|nr:hypothetical protein [Lachnospiraceae bacterium]